MRVIWPFFLMLILVLAAPLASAADITAVRSWRAPDNTRLVLDMSGPAKASISPDSTPARVIVDIEGMQLAGPIALPSVVPPLRAVRFERSANGQRLIVELLQEVSTRLFQLPPNEQYSHRLVLDLYDKPTQPLPPASATAPSTLVTTPVPPLTNPAVDVSGAAPSPAAATTHPSEPGAPAASGSTPAATATAGTTPASTAPASSAPASSATVGTVPAPTTAVSPSLPVMTATPTPVAKPVEKAPDTSVDAIPEKASSGERPDPRRYRNVIVALDPGHGGEDPGAIGARGSYEKHVTLAIARELEAMLKAEPGFTPVLTRTGDYFLPLVERRRLARHQHKADIFISIHADAAENRAARGASVFALSLKGAGSATSRFARMLAERENRSDLIGGAAIESGDDTLRNVLADMVVAGSLDHSLHLGRNILDRFSHFTPLHSRRVEQAGFAVLKEPGMVSLLVETGFISNPQEEEKLTDKRHQRELAKAIFDGLLRYNQKYPAPGTYFAWAADRPGKSNAVAAAPVRATENTGAQASQPVLSANEGARAAALMGGGNTTTTINSNATPKPSAKATPGELRYRVVSGDTLTRIASRHNVSMKVLREHNQLKDDNVKIGQVLKIPAR
ncbi:MAG: N-acetylmuramoyl-L-alanine amidase [Moraxellaceae bacterium]|nr:N-acetylmuramoyl-L-alanine amidase [Moraxellaceae bacterium]